MREINVPLCPGGIRKWSIGRPGAVGAFLGGGRAPVTLNICGHVRIFFFLVYGAFERWTTVSDRCPIGAAGTVVNSVQQEF
ncbi:hypothetical protein CDAR_374941 [Caerostris darwini]|uniref:Uncharacterized protein n=1 Tax=Caerostris darwini TaxID=1538125 RepID=A0AAV4RK15_9ARAC|nr:hypothetical protein CDAR_374941 [Caerostris darwini]